MRNLRKNYQHFIERKLFDLVHQTQTSQMESIKDFKNPTDLHHGKDYYASWTSEVKNAHQHLRKLLALEKYQFIDLGCGKGKTCLVWELENLRYGITQKILGVDFHEPFIQIAKSNHRKIFKNDGNFECINVKEVNYYGFTKPLIIYLFNPFDAVMLHQTLEKIGKVPTLAIYNIPVYGETFREHGYKVSDTKQGKNQNQTTTMFQNF